MSGRAKLACYERGCYRWRKPPENEMSQGITKAQATAPKTPAV
jgi:hypothetical protein